MIGGSFVALVLGCVAIAVTPGHHASRRDRTLLDVANLAAATRVFQARTGRLPVGPQELTEQHPAYPWGRPYRYWLVRGVPVFVSLGADGRCGGTDQDADLASQNLRSVGAECTERDR
jgi:hypothetical protein